MANQDDQETVKQRIGGFLQRHFFSGLLVWVPIVVTVVVITFLVDLLDQTLLLVPEHLRPDQLLGFHIPGLGVLLSIAIVIITGVFLANFFGQWLFGFWERFLVRLPLVRSIYTAVKQVTETVLSPSGQAFRKVVLVEWPRKGMWSVAFVTTETTKRLADLTDESLINVFVPATPNITSGFLMMVSRDQMKEIDMTVEEALKLVVSLGVVQPPHANTDSPRNNK